MISSKVVGLRAIDLSLLCRVYVISFALMLSACSVLPSDEDEEKTNTEISKTEPTLQETRESIIALASDENVLIKPKAEPINSEVVSDRKDKSTDELTTAEVKTYQQKQAELIKTLPRDVLIQYKAAIILMRQKKWQTADTIFDELIVQQPLLSGCYVNKSIIATKNNDDGRAEELLLKAIAINPENPNAHNLLAQHYRKKGLFIEAEREYLKALELAPERIKNHLNLAVLYELYQGNFTKAEHHYAAYLAVNPDDKKVQLWAAGLALKMPVEKVEQ